MNVQGCDAIKVFLRLRPINELEKINGGKICVKHTKT